MQQPLRTALHRCEIKHSRFIAVVAPYQDFDAMLVQLQGEHARASHHCRAARWIDLDGRINELAHDDGEPSGTAARPMLRVLQSGDWINVGAVVVRYFGGTKLGTGGLARAYAGAVQSALESMPASQWVAIRDAKISVKFASIDALERAVRAFDLTVISREFTATGVCLELRGQSAHIDELRAKHEAY
jgi:uncharacterized YigZ family protein